MLKNVLIQHYSKQDRINVQQKYVVDVDEINFKRKRKFFFCFSSHFLRIQLIYLKFRIFTGCVRMNN